MPATLEDSWTKHARGTEHLGALVRECDEYLRAMVASAEMIRDQETGEMEVRLRGDPPPRLGAIVGDVAHNLRSALDVAAWQLAIANDEVAARRRSNAVQFPLTRTAEIFKDHSAVTFFSDSTREVIESLQPYRLNMEALGWLRDISNSDKHRIATFSFTGMTTDSASEAGVQAFSNLHVRFGTEEGHLGLMGLHAIGVTVESALRELEARCQEARC
jgi:hypothetical protein